MSNSTTLTIQYYSHNTPDPTRNMVQIAGKIYTYEEGQDLDILITSYQGLPELNLPQTALSHLLVIGEIQIVQDADGNQHLEMQADMIQQLPQMPNWEGHPMANKMALAPIAYCKAVGNVGSVNDRDGLREANNGKMVCNRSMACTWNRQRSNTSWFKADFWDKLATDVASKYLNKGTKFSVDGKLKFNCYTTKTDGKFRIEPTIEVRSLELLGSREDKDRPAYGGGSSAPMPPAAAAISPNPTPPAAAVSYDEIHY